MSPFYHIQGETGILAVSVTCQRVDQMGASHIPAQADYFWLDRFQTRAAFLHNLISSEWISSSVQNIFTLLLFHTS